MFLHIEDSMRIEEVEERFAECFPMLSVAFYSEPHQRFAPTGNRCRLPGDKRIDEVRRSGNNGVLEIKSWYSVAKVEKSIHELFGLHAQIFRSNPDGSLTQTSLSDHLTLQEQSNLVFDAVRSIS